MPLIPYAVIFHKICATGDIRTIPGRFCVVSISLFAQILWKIIPSTVRFILPDKIYQQKGDT